MWVCRCVGMSQDILGILNLWNAIVFSYIINIEFHVVLAKTYRKISMITRKAQKPRIGLFFFVEGFFLGAFSKEFIRRENSLQKNALRMHCK